MYFGQKQFFKNARIKKIKQSIFSAWGVFPLAFLLLGVFYLPLLYIVSETFLDDRVAPFFVNMQKLWFTDATTALPNIKTQCVFVDDLVGMKKAERLGRLTRTVVRHDTRMRRMILNASKAFNEPVDCNNDAEKVVKKLHALSPLWQDPGIWQRIYTLTQRFTLIHVLNAFDMTIDDHGDWVMQPERERIYIDILLRTLFLSMLIAVLCLLISYPFAYYLVISKSRYKYLWFIAVLLPFWTPVLVRIVCALVTLSRYGLVNQLLWFLGVIDDQNRLALLYNATGTVLTMSFIQMPYMILSLYASMSGISPTLLRASSSLGANGLMSFFRVYLPLTYPGIAAGLTLVFVISVGYYITPAIVGGSMGTFISNSIDFHMNNTLNWGLASSLSILLLLATLAIYWVYSKLIGKELGEF